MSHEHKKSVLEKPYQEGDIKNGEENFTQRAGQVLPVETESKTLDLLHEHGSGLG